MEVKIQDSFEPSAKISELAVFIDIFRASTSIICLLHRGARKVLGIRDEEELKAALAAGYRLVSEVVKTDMDNSPSRILASDRSGERFAHKSGNLTEAVFANLGWKRAIICGFVNLDAVVAWIRSSGVSSVTIIPAQHFAEKKKAVEDESCAVMLKEILDGANVNLNPAVQGRFHWKKQGTELFCRIPRWSGGGPSAMRARPDEVYASRRAPAMRAGSCNCNFQVKEYPYYPEIEAKIRRRENSGSPFPEHYREDLRVSLQRNTFPVVPEIFKADGKVIFDLKAAAP